MSHLLWDMNQVKIVRKLQFHKIALTLKKIQKTLKNGETLGAVETTENFFGSERFLELPPGYV